MLLKPTGCSRPFIEKKLVDPLTASKSQKLFLKKPEILVQKSRLKTVQALPSLLPIAVGHKALPEPHQAARQVEANRLTVIEPADQCDDHTVICSKNKQRKTYFIGNNVTVLCDPFRGKLAVDETYGKSQ